MAKSTRDIDGRWVATVAELGGVRLPAEALSDLALKLSKGTFRPERSQHPHRAARDVDTIQPDHSLDSASWYCYDCRRGFDVESIGDAGTQKPHWLSTAGSHPKR